MKAFVVPRSGDSVGLERRLQNFCRTHMPPQLVPREIVVLQSLPKNTAGKALRCALKESI